MEKIKIDEINNYLLFYLNKHYLKEDKIKSSINKIINKLNICNSTTERHKYLALSCIFGAFLGDAIGANTEFFGPSPHNHYYIFKNINGKFIPGEITDDSEMAMSAAFAYMDAENENDPRIQSLIYYYFCIWGYSSPKDMGNTTAKSLQFWDIRLNIEQTNYNNKIKQIIQQENLKSLANGFLMRISTFIVFYYYTRYEKIHNTIQIYFNNYINYQELTKDLLDLVFDIYKEVVKNTEITHPNLETAISATIFSLLVLVGMVRNNAQEMYSLFKIIVKSKIFIESCLDSNYKKQVQINQKIYANIINEIEKNIKKDVYNKMGYYMHAFKLSLYYLYKYPEMGKNNDPNLYYNIMCEICDLGGDTDTNCAIVGTMIGPLIGYKNFKKELFDKFIKFYPEKRTQYTSAFMYIYVNYLEEKYLHKIKHYQHKQGEIYKYPGFVKLLEFLNDKIE